MHDIVVNISRIRERYKRYQEYHGEKEDTFGLEEFNEAKIEELTLSGLEGGQSVVIFFAYETFFYEIMSRWLLKEDISRVEQEKLGELGIRHKVFFSLAQVVLVCKASHVFIDVHLKKHDFLKELSKDISNGKYSGKNKEDTERVLLSYYRLAFCDAERFKKYINFSALYLLLKYLASEHCVIRYLVLKILQFYSNISERRCEEIFNKFIIEKRLISLYDNKQEIDFFFLPLVESKRISNFNRLSHETFSTSNTNLITVPLCFFSKFLNVVHGYLILNYQVLEDRPINFFNRSLRLFVPLTTSLRTVKNVVKCIQNNECVLLYGNTGTGKTFIVNYLAELIYHGDFLLKIHLGEQTDLNILLGSYRLGTQPGDFQWSEGVLTKAVREGRWILIENIDKVPNDVLCILNTLLEKKELKIPSRNETIKAKNGFLLFSTITTQNKEIPEIYGQNFWRLLNTEDFKRSDLIELLSHMYSNLKRNLDDIINIYDQMVKLDNSKRFQILNRDLSPRKINTNTMINFCARINHLLKDYKIDDTSNIFTGDFAEVIFIETINFFGGYLNNEHAFDLMFESIVPFFNSCLNTSLEFYKKNYTPNFSIDKKNVYIGKWRLPKYNVQLFDESINYESSFAKTSHFLKLIEKIGSSVFLSEPVLLVGETGIGKTFAIQQLAQMMNKKLHVINVSHETESSDLLGSYKPFNIKMSVYLNQDIFDTLFNETFSKKKNFHFINILHDCIKKSQWNNVIRVWKEAVLISKKHIKKLIDDSKESLQQKKRKKSVNLSLLFNKWVDFENKISFFQIQNSKSQNSFIFDFHESLLIKAVKNGDWILLDEINLASIDTLESILELLNSAANQRSILLFEKGEINSIKAHDDFRIFGSMNPSTDIGKKDLSHSIRMMFTEIYVNSPDNNTKDLLLIIRKYIGKHIFGDDEVENDISQLYIEAKIMAQNHILVDGANLNPHFSIRTLTRALKYSCCIFHLYGIRKSLYEAFSMCFLTSLNSSSEALLEPIISKYTVGKLKNKDSVVCQVFDKNLNKDNLIKFEHFWITKGNEPIISRDDYIITPFIKKNLLVLVRAISAKNYSILIQGPTSSGKTSMIKYLANIFGHKFVRVNNHEHTEIQEYLGSYFSDSTGKLVFKEGVLTESLRKGYWIVLDELNLAPSDVLESLNRLLDDNREILLMETQEVIKPHPNFMLFATQNPPGIYGGRKFLSNAFRNRFLELHFDEIPQNELQVILHKKCQIPSSYAEKIVSVYSNLSIQRQSSRIFENKNSFATLRDLFRWGLRQSVGYEELAYNGYMLLAEKVRDKNEKVVVKQVIERVMKVSLDMDKHYENIKNEIFKFLKPVVVFTKPMTRLLVLIYTSFLYNEPVLLVGQTGSGKTSACEVIADFFNKNLIILNGHQNTETSDVMGTQRPSRKKLEYKYDLFNKLTTFFDSLGLKLLTEDSKFENILKKYESFSFTSEIDTKLIDEINVIKTKYLSLFEWFDGPLVESMKKGCFFLFDEISLVDDSILERFNSVLEPERSLFLAEKGDENLNVSAKDGFQFIATMNPGGDYGKKELSSALRNRFTEIWVSSIEDFNDIKQIISSKIKKNALMYVDSITKYSEWFTNEFYKNFLSDFVISIRDILSWIDFINKTSDKTGVEVSIINGALLVFIDPLGTNNTAHLSSNRVELENQKLKCLSKLSEFINFDYKSFCKRQKKLLITDTELKADLYAIPIKKLYNQKLFYNLNVSTTSKNVMKVIRALQLKKPILLEGSPGVGKTSLITSIAQITGNNLIRINFSNETDLIDLFGSDVPSDTGIMGEFKWKDAPFLKAIKNGDWILLDEMNLASQSVLEGLNSCLDHRESVYIPELNKTFKCHKDFRVFASQNSYIHGGGRKGLPKSFINRFFVVQIDDLTFEDLILISHFLYPNIDKDIISKSVLFMEKLNLMSINHEWKNPKTYFDFNLRDITRWFKILSTDSLANILKPEDCLDLLIFQRLNLDDDKKKVCEIFVSIFGSIQKKNSFYYNSIDYLHVFNSIIEKKPFIHYDNGFKSGNLICNLPLIETIIRCINHSFPLVLSGASNTGKKYLIRHIANIVGFKLNEFLINKNTDSMDFIGGYDQVNVIRLITKVWKQFYNYLNLKFVSSIDEMHLNFNPSSDYIELLNFLSSSQITLSNYKILFEKVLQLRVKQNNNDFDFFYNEFINLNKFLDKKNSIEFKWFDGLLINSVIKGEWLILNNANLCNSSVFDRLNSLFESNGYLVLNECSLEDGSPRIIKPHPDFRVFLTINPKFGELSQSMRNRCVNICVDDFIPRMTKLDLEIFGLEKNDQNQKHSQNLINEKPLKSNFTSFFLPIKDQNLRIFAVIDDICVLSEKKNLIVSNSIIGILNHFSFSILERWNNLTLNCNEFNNLIKLILQNIFRSSVYLKEKNLVLNFFLFTSKIYEKFIKENVNINFQSSLYFNPFLNYKFDYFSNINVNKSQILELLYFYEVILSFDKFISDIKIIEKNLLTKNVNELNYIEKQAAIELGRSLNFKSELNFFSIIKQIIDFLHSFFEKNLSINSLMNNKLNHLFYKIMIILKLLFKVISVKNDEKIYCFVQLIIESFNKHLNLIPDNDLKIVENFLNNQNKQLKLNQTFLTVKIWNHFKSKYPNSKIAWDMFDILYDLIKDIDDVFAIQHGETRDTLYNLRMSIIEIYNDLVSNDLNNKNYETLFEKLKHDILDLKQISESFIHDSDNLLEYEFKVLSNIMQLSFEINYKDILSLSLFSGISTTIFLKKNENICSPYPLIFDTLSSETKIETSIIKCFFFDDLFKMTLKKCQDFYFTSSKNLEKNLFNLRTFGENLILNSNIILNNNLVFFKNFLIYWMSKIVLACSSDYTNDVQSDIKYINNITNFTNLDVEILFNILKNTNNDYLKPYLNNYFVSSLRLLVDTSDLTSLGKSWVLFSYGLLQIFLPKFSYDPAVYTKVSHGYFEDLKDSHQNIQDFLNLINDFIGIDRINVDDDTIMKEEIHTNTKKFVYRDNKLFHELFDQWKSLLDSFTEIMQINVIFKSSCLTENFIKKAKLFQLNSFNFFKQIKKKYRIFSDLNDIFKGLIYGISFGFELIFIDLEKQENELINSSFLFDLSFLTNSILIEEKITETRPFFNDYHLNSMLPENLIILFITLIFFQDKTSKKNLNILLFDLFELIFSRWKSRCIIEEHNQEKEDNLYYFFDDYDDENDISNLFNNYVSKKDSNDVFEEISFMLSEIYINHFVHNIPIDLDFMIRRCYDVFFVLNSEQKCTFDKNNHYFIFFVIIMLSKTCLSFSNEKKINFYQSSFHSEFEKSVSIISNTHSEVEKILTKWPENEILKNILNSCNDYLNYPLNSSLYKNLQKIEQIYMFLGEWMKYASREFSLETFFNQLSQLIISWRKLELSTWKSFFEEEDKELKRKLGKWWFHLYEIILRPILMNNCSENDNYFELFSSLKSFLIESNYGDFGYKFHLLEAFRNHLYQLNSHHRVYHLISNLLLFFNQFTPIVIKNFTTNKEELESEIVKIIKLASWKDLKMIFLKESSRKWHLALLKTVKKYRLLLKTPIESIINEENLPNESLDYIAPEVLQLHFESDYNDVNFTSKNTLILNLKLIFPNDISLIDTKITTVLSNLSSEDEDSLYYFAKDLLEEVKNLKSETLKISTNDNKNSIKSLRSQKLKLFNDSLKKLKSSGLKINLSKEILDVQLSVPYILSTSKSFYNTNFDKAETYFFKVLNYFQKLNLAVNNTHYDFLRENIKKAYNIFCSILFHLIDIRTILESFSCSMDIFQSLCIIIEYFSKINLKDINQKKIIINKSNICRLERIKSFLYSFTKLLEFFIIAQKAISFFNNNLSFDFIESLSMSLKKYVNIFSTLDKKILQIECNKYTDDILKILDDFEYQLDSWSKKHSNHRIISNVFKSQILNFKNILSDKPCLEATMNSSQNEFVDLVNECKSLILIVFQKLHNLNIKNTNSDHSNWFIHSKNLIIKQINISNHHLISSRISKCFELFLTLPNDSDDFLSSCSFLKANLYLFNHYFTLISTIFKKSWCFYSNSSHGCFILTSLLYLISSEGFCEPSNMEESSSNENKKCEGFGKGEDENKASKDLQDESMSSEAENDNPIDKKDISGDTANFDNNSDLDFQSDSSQNLQNSDLDSDEDRDLEEEVGSGENSNDDNVDIDFWNDDEEITKDEKTEEKMKKNEEKMNFNPEYDAQESENDKENIKENECEDDQNDNKNNKLDNSKEYETGTDFSDFSDDDSPPKNELKNEMDNIDKEDEESLPNNMEVIEDNLDEKLGSETDLCNSDENLGEEEVQNKQETDPNSSDVDDTTKKNEEEVGGNQIGDNDSNNSIENSYENQNLNLEENATLTNNNNSEHGCNNEDNKQDSFSNNKKHVIGNKSSNFDNIQNSASNFDYKTPNVAENDDTGDINQMEIRDTFDDFKYDNPNNVYKYRQDIAREALKKLGDKFKEFHLDNKNIVDCESNDEQIDENENHFNEFKYSHEDDKESNKQSLGFANDSQKQSITNNNEENHPDCEINDDAMDVVNMNEQDFLKEEKEFNQNMDDITNLNSKNHYDTTFQKKNLTSFETKTENMTFETDDDFLSDEDLNLDKKVVFPPIDLEKAYILWKQSDMVTKDLTSELCEQLRLILEPTLATKLKGDYKSGKKINLRKIIPYIASDFKKDKIWLKRLKPHKRDYQIMIALDDSKSMKENNSIELSFHSIALVLKALLQLGSGDISVIRFGEDVDLIHPFEKPFLIHNSGPQIFQWFSFQQTITDINLLCEKSIKIFKTTKYKNPDLWQLQIIISDGIFEDHDSILKMVRKAREEKIMIVFVIIDNINEKESILEMNQVKYLENKLNGNMDIVIDKYLDLFPFEYYVVVKNIQSLPKTLSLILRQYFSATLS